MAKARYFPFRPDEYIAGIIGLTFEEQGVYWACCALIYSRGKPIEPDYGAIASLGRTTAARAKKVIATLMEKGKLLEMDRGRIGVHRVMEEISTANDLATNSKRNGKLGGRPKKKQQVSEPGPFQNEKPTNNYNDNDNVQKSLDLTPSPSTQKTSLESEPAGSAPHFRFEGEVIRLDDRDYTRLKRTFTHLNGSFEGELAKADAYYADNPPRDGKWWFQLSKWLAKADKEATPLTRHERLGSDML